MNQRKEKRAAQSPKRTSISKDEVVTLKVMMEAFDIRDRRTALKLLKAYGLPTSPVAGRVLVNGELLHEATKNRPEQ
ncbi:sn-glycerol-1-phosphate dehydrogenase [Roseiconus nitratireducens]|uniref:sn-glycerol-1-phosphate dehydrogenase n=1 Tax=Roseiconus nitratireducens TaxID=2605748 RepID=A0A5M6DL75_9BACT|nr:sn-glycerol-1-phosphate dehydrogenase [Roseiconus nitratireducens]KAA5547002.1 sn-glycerol-1-phosphate dehydrogenase [Roseiconus nitratireducens]